MLLAFLFFLSVFLPVQVMPTCMEKRHARSSHGILLCIAKASASPEPHLHPHNTPLLPALHPTLLLDTESSVIVTGVQECVHALNFMCSYLFVFLSVCLLSLLSPLSATFVYESRTTSWYGRAG